MKMLSPAETRIAKEKQKQAEFKRAYAIKEDLLELITSVGIKSQRRWEPRYRNEVGKGDRTTESFLETNSILTTADQTPAPFCNIPSTLRQMQLVS